MPHHPVFAAATGCLWFLVNVAYAEAPARDNLFPGQGRWSLALATGSPFVAMAETAIGVTDRATLGVIIGQTPQLWGIGLRPRAILWREADQRVTLIVPTLYYPRANRSDQQPWMLTRPSVIFEQTTENARLHLGIGLVIAAAIGDPVPQVEGEILSSARFDHGTWASAQLGVWLPLSHAWSAFGDVDLIYDVDGPRWTRVGGPRVVISLGVSWLP